MNERPIISSVFIANSGCTVIASSLRVQPTTLHQPTMHLRATMRPKNVKLRCADQTNEPIFSLYEKKTMTDISRQFPKGSKTREKHLTNSSYMDSNSYTKYTFQLITEKTESKCTWPAFFKKNISLA